MVGSMKTFTKPAGAIRLEPCRYGTSRVSFRGPRRRTDGRFIACLGASDTFAKYVPKPYPQLIETAVGEVCVNLGCQAAGPDVFLRDTAIQSLCHDAMAVVIEVMGAANLSNGFYRVHPRRNDRFIAPTQKLRALYPEVDFAEVAFTGHLIQMLQAVDAERFEVVREHLQETWIERMQTLVAQTTGPVLLLWFAAVQPDEVHHDTTQGPLFVTRPMLEALRPYVDDVIEVVSPSNDADGMMFPPLEALAVKDCMGVAAHRAAAEALRVPVLHCAG